MSILEYHEVSLKDVAFSKVSLNNVPAEDSKNKWGGSLRTAAIEDLNFADGKVMLSGLSNQEFASTFRSIPFPFDNTQNTSSLEIYHAAHGKYETEASGGINLENIREYAATGVDYISSGAVIHQAKSVDLSLKAQIL